MNQYVAFLRAINVGGRAKVKMNDLKHAFTQAGCKDVTTFIQSGNVLFTAPEPDTTSIMQNIQLNLNELLSADATVMYRTLREVKSLLNAAPFNAVPTSADIKLYVAFLAKKPTNKPTLPLHSEKEALEAIKLRNLNIFVVSRKKSNGMFGFPNNFVEKEFGVPATTRNWKTITKIAEQK